MDKNYWIEWLKAAGIRALKTFAQTFAGFLVVGATMSEVHWGVALSTSGVAAVLSLVTSIAGIPEVQKPKEE